ncbi:hypothetical protein BDU57DRAFT_139278 [Ampelomyces quisqualis]|uniref:RING-type domain-containing protein n=1 Tax=Ampelomyces quisqualis TaxID=50730 RepID=A0A6A5QU94_AMPQU|nr:hypothetical protein BDU57DRAFT_139278 [Ampelomyces quisqualis]
MPALLNRHDVFLAKREWRNTVGQSGMTPTAFAFLIPVFVVVVFAPFMMFSLCVFCIRKRQRNTPVPPPRKVKKPALRRAEARERLTQFTNVADVTDVTDERGIAPEGQTAVSTTIEVTSTPVADSSSVSEQECAICLSTLHAPAPPEPALITTTTHPTSVNEAATRPASIHSTSPPDSILKLHTCSHTFHAECLVSWFVLRKTTCPICRTPYISEEDMQAYEEEEAVILASEVGEVEQMGMVDAEAQRTGVAERVSNWRYFWAGESVRGRQNGVGGEGRMRTWRIWRNS